ncbi:MULTISPECIES: DMT family transporter [unclassified Rhizobium]|jgi:drug/metabolite transporter (DMT)-like permease|uniref:DMT family transporter n=1 Tax=unclassified Rhizobium TaxID=2613769 RepID=UPI0006488C5B|nr:MULTISPECIES: DMT family transporter [unclassified Rhizobium]MBN8954871.1 DMT family transporter [Rhizobium tropici]OJY70711.1 MAG: multidrug DMT transporter permease [Rhizobium sp. 60-20]RKD52188.1 S-adenosylmethionine uptake transporter [Rhizobium sp. WW_1]
MSVGKAASNGNLVLAGMLLMLFGDFMFALNDAMGKWLVASFSVGQILVIRSFGSFIVLAPMLARQGSDALFRLERPPLQLLRVVMTTVDVALFYAAVTYLPLADVMTFYMAGPIYVAAISHFFLGERIGWRRWLAVFVGFIGVLIALRPSAAMFSWPSLFGLGGSLAFALTLVLGRRLRQTRDATLVAWQTVGALVAGLVLSIGSWRPASTLDLGAMLALGVVAGSAHLMITRSLKYAPASLLAPLQYSLLVWAIVLGFVFFGDIPDMQIIVGSVIIVLAGLFIFHRKNLVDTVREDAVARDGH